MWVLLAPRGIVAYFNLNLTYQSVSRNVLQAKINKLIMNIGKN